MVGLVPFGIAGAMGDPQVTLYSGSQAVIAVNNNWGGDAALAGTASRVGAFALVNPGSFDAVLLRTLDPGSYTAEVQGVANTGGVAIVEVYEVP